MTLEIPGIRIAFISEDTMSKIDELRGFRHVFRNIYGFNLTSEKVIQLLNKLPIIASSFKDEVEVFFEKMDQLMPE